MKKETKFGFRKSKAYKTLCGAVLGTALIVLGSQVASADEKNISLVPVAVENTTPNPATNLPGAQAEATEDQKQAIANENKSSGNVTTPVSDTNLNKAVEVAKKAGVTVEQGATETVSSDKEAENKFADQKAKVDQTTKAQNDAKASVAETVATAEKAGLKVTKTGAKEYGNLEEAKKDLEAQKNQVNQAKSEQDKSNKQVEDAVVAAKQAGVEVTQGETITVKKEEASAKTAEVIQKVNAVIAKNQAAQAAYATEKAKKEKEYQEAFSKYNDALAKKLLVEQERRASLNRVAVDIATKTQDTQNDEYGHSFMRASINDNHFTFTHDLVDGVGVIGTGTLTGGLNYQYIVNEDGSIDVELISMYLHTYKYTKTKDNEAVNQDISFKIFDQATGKLIYAQPHHGANSFTETIRKTVPLNLRRRIAPHSSSGYINFVKIHDDWIHDTHGWGAIRFTNNNGALPQLPKIPPVPTLPQLKKPSAEKVTVPKFQVATTVHDVKLKTTVNPLQVKRTPDISKAVVNSDGQDVNDHYVVKNSNNVYHLNINPLPANRPEYTAGRLVDNLPNGLKVDVERTNQANTDYSIAIDKSGKTVINFKDSLIKSLNADKMKAFNFKPVKIYFAPQNDAATYINVFNLVLTGKDPKDNVTKTSNKVVIKTPGKEDPEKPDDPNNPNRDKIKPEKHNYNVKGDLIDGKTTLQGEINQYKAIWKKSPYKNMVITKEAEKTIQAYIDDYDESKVTPLIDRFTIKDAQGKTVNGLKLYHVLSGQAQDEVIKKVLGLTGIKPKGNFLMWVAENSAEHLTKYNQTGTNIVFNLPMQNKTNVTGQYTNTVYQVDYNNGYYGEPVINDILKPEPKKDVAKSIKEAQAKKSINGQTIQLDTEVTYQLKSTHFPANRSKALDSLVYVDQFDKKVEYQNKFQFFATVDFKLKDGSIIKQGQDLTQYVKASYDKATHTVTYSFDSAFLAKVSPASQFGVEGYAYVKQIAPGKTVNQFDEFVNELATKSNVVETNTPPKPEKPKKDEPPKPGEPKKDEPPKPETPKPKLPETGSNQSTGLSVLGLAMAAFAFIVRKKEEN